jgi:hypothetical protein
MVQFQPEDLVAFNVIEVAKLFRHPLNTFPKMKTYKPYHHVVKSKEATCN